MTSPHTSAFVKRLTRVAPRRGPGSIAGVRPLLLSLALVACSEPTIFGDVDDAQGGAGVTASSTSSAGRVPAGPGGAGGEGGAASVGGAGGAPTGPGGGPQGCSTPADCPGTDGECSWRTCTASACGVAHAPAGTPLAAQVSGDCQTATCDGQGGLTSSYTPSDLPGDPGCSSCSPSGPVYEPTGERCNEACGCPQQNGGTCGPSSVPCTQGLCDGGGSCVDHIPVTCVTLQFKDGTNTYTRCDLTAGAFSISWDTANCAAFECHCNLLASDVGYCAPGTACYVYDSNGVWLGPQQGTGTCQ